MMGFKTCGTGCCLDEFLMFTVMTLKDLKSVRWVNNFSAKAIFVSSKVGIEAAGINEGTFAGLNILLRVKCEEFPHPNPKILKQKKLNSRSA